MSQPNAQTPQPAADTSTVPESGWAEDETLHVVDMPGPPDEDPIRESIIIDDWGRAPEEPYRDTEVPGLQ